MGRSRTGQFDEVVRTEMVALLPRLRRFALALTAAMPEADDLVQATCERAVKNLDKWTPGSRLDSWLFRIAQNLHRNRLRDTHTRLRILDGLAAAAPRAVDGAAVVDSHITLSAVRRHVLSLPQEQREVVMLICVEGWSYQEAADLLDVPIGTVTSRLARARESLRGAFQDEPALPKIAQGSG